MSITPADTDTPSDWALDHISVSADEDSQTLQQLLQLFKLRAAHRPPFPFPGRWFYQQDKAVLHVIDEPAGTAAFRLNHIAFRSEAAASMVMPLLEAAGLTYHTVNVPAEDTLQIFIRLTPALLLELDLPADADIAASYRYSTSAKAPAASDVT